MIFFFNLLSGSSLLLLLFPNYQVFCSCFSLIKKLSKQSNQGLCTILAQVFQGGWKTKSNLGQSSRQKSIKKFQATESDQGAIIELPWEQIQHVGYIWCSDDSLYHQTENWRQLARLHLVDTTGQLIHSNHLLQPWHGQRHSRHKA